MALGRTSAFTKIAKTKEPPTEAPSSTPTPVARSVGRGSGVAGDVGKGLGAARRIAPAVEKGFGALKSTTFPREEGGYQDYRTGERQPQDTGGVAAEAAVPGGIWAAMPSDISTAWQNYAPGVARDNPLPEGANQANVNEEGLPIGDPTEMGTPSSGIAPSGGGLGFGSTLGGAQGLLNLIEGIRGSNPAQATTGALGAYSAASSIWPKTIPSISTGLGALAGSPGLAAGLSTAGSAASALALPLLAITFGNLMGSKINLLDAFTGGKTSDYASFSDKLGENQQQQNTALKILSQAIPYAQSKEELGKLMNAYRAYASSTNSAPLNAPSDVYNLTTIPGTSGQEHGGSVPGVDWGGPTAALQGFINQYRGALPGTDLVDFATQPTGPDHMRLWQQFTDREQTAPMYQPEDRSGQVINPGSEFETQTAPHAAGFYGASEFPRFGDLGQIGYGQAGYDYAGSGYPEPGKFVGAPFSGPSPSGFGSVSNSLQGSTGFAGLSKPYAELAADNPNRI